MKKLILMCIRSLLLTVYGLVKTFTRVNPKKVLFLSRRMNAMPLDFRLLQEELQRRDPDLRLVSICRLYANGMKQIIGFMPALMRSVYHLASSRICVLDSYWPTVSALEQRKSLTVYQLWHALGKIKQTGHQTLDRQQGHSSVTAGVMKMHGGYDYIVAGGKVWEEQYKAAFNVGADQLLNFGLPRADYLYTERQITARRIRAAQPELQGRTVVMYAPTFRRGSSPDGALRLARALPPGYVLVIKAHRSDHLKLPKDGYTTCPNFTSTDLLTVADYLITDYSSLALEAAIVNLPTFYYLYDEERYLSENGLNLDLHQEMPGCVYNHAEDVVNAIQEPYPYETLTAYREKFIGFELGRSAANIADHMLGKTNA